MRILFFLLIVLFSAFGKISQVDYTGESTWIPMNKRGISGVDGAVFALTSQDTLLYAGGEFSLAGGESVQNIAVWDGHRWQPVGEGCTGPVSFLGCDTAGVLYAVTDGDHFSRVNRWDGEKWKIIADTVHGGIDGMVVSPDGAVYVVGVFAEIGGKKIERYARWNGKEWEPLAEGYPYEMEIDSHNKTIVSDWHGGFYLMERWETYDNIYQIIHYTGNGWEEPHYVEFDRYFHQPGIVVNGAGELIVFGSMPDSSGEKSGAAILAKDRTWRDVSFDYDIGEISCALPVRGEPGNVWVGIDECLYQFDGDTIHNVLCNVGTALVQMEDGTLYTGARSGLHNVKGTRATIVRYSDTVWSGVDSAVLDPDDPLDYDRALKMELFSEIFANMKDIPPTVTQGNLGDICIDKRGGVYFVGGFSFTRGDTIHHNITYWNGTSFQPLGEGLFGRDGTFFISGRKLALDPRGVLYAANVTDGRSRKEFDLVRWNGDYWELVRKTPRLSDLEFDRYGNLYAVAYNKDARSRSRSYFCRIPIDTPDAPIVRIAPETLFDNYGIGSLSIDRSKVHLYGGFFHVGNMVSPGHVAWELPKTKRRGKRVRRRGGGSLPLEERYQLRLEESSMRLEDTTAVRYDSYAIRLRTAKPLDTIVVTVKDTVELQARTYGKTIGWYTPSRIIEPEEDGYRVKLILRESMKPGERPSLKISHMIRERIADNGSGELTFRSVMVPLIRNSTVPEDESFTLRVWNLTSYSIPGVKEKSIPVVTQFNEPYKLKFRSLKEKE